MHLLVWVKQAGPHEKVLVSCPDPTPAEGGVWARDYMRWMTRGQVIVSHAHDIIKLLLFDSRHLLVVVFLSLMFGKCYNFLSRKFLSDTVQVV